MYKKRHGKRRTNGVKTGRSTVTVRRLYQRRLCASLPGYISLNYGETKVTDRSQSLTYSTRKLHPIHLFMCKTLSLVASLVPF